MKTKKALLISDGTRKGMYSWPTSGKTQHANLLPGDLATSFEGLKSLRHSHSYA